MKRLYFVAFGVMITLTVQRLLDSSLPHNSPRTVVLGGFPSLVSSCVYAFMCHHSLPSLLSPISDKSRLQRSLAADYFIVLCFYLTLAVPGEFSILFLWWDSKSKNNMLSDFCKCLIVVVVCSETMFRNPSLVYTIYATSKTDSKKNFLYINFSIKKGVNFAICILCEWKQAWLVVYNGHMDMRMSE